MVGSDDSRTGDPLTAPSPTWLGEKAGSLRVLAEIWATVELERALADLARRAVVAGAADAIGAADVVAGAVDDPLLGARVVVVPSGPGAPPVALAEPSTEGRLAATLARHDEGPAGRYVVAPASLDVVRALARAARVPLSRLAVGPFGPSVLVLSGSVTGPHLILVDPAAVPSRP